ncbi:hypothetical protein NP493_1g04033 [Ridgeia piscesae]|uniref:HAUS augmin-like complex subunit 7 n=1 Tax=Ridgeia piscesae TaxID=27915 RepID=A0AAD9PGR7_RIDPI|nr:hypothetical protein NP493_1g04033 [Ridgeia piscesae]
MAACLNNSALNRSLAKEKNDKKLMKAAKRFKEQLEDLGCPFTEGVEDWWIIELIFKPGEARIRLLQWLLVRFDEKLNNVLEPEHAATDVKMDSRLQRILFVASSLGLCHPDDADLIRGTTTNAKQLCFMGQLLDLLTILDAAGDPRTKSMQSPGVVSDGMPRAEQCLRDCWLMDSLASQCMPALFDARCKLLPLDLVKQVERRTRDSKETFGVPDTQRLAEMVSQCQRDLDKQTDLLQELHQKVDNCAEDEQKAVMLKSKLRLVLSELSQLITSFSYCFENELVAWCNKPSPVLNDLGPAFKKVHILLQQFTKACVRPFLKLLTEGLSTIRQSHDKLCTQLMTDIHTMTADNQLERATSSGLSTVEGFQKCISIVQESIKVAERKKRAIQLTIANSPMNKSSTGVATSK